MSRTKGRPRILGVVDVRCLMQVRKNYELMAGLSRILEGMKAFAAAGLYPKAGRHDNGDCRIS
ncbi:MAG: hypothetical protein JW984_13845 [Deltaproteobacteria bacterium]|uniref:Uncharacterized protein n=1 Tax=Candidatus Zymogenus saltonus TaxID=2844893 RepID=A0A9D8PNR8_9DELT|nr:hypothetical protein [Candidatus Zymogenus saltonus]